MFNHIQVRNFRIIAKTYVVWKFPTKFRNYWYYGLDERLALQRHTELWFYWHRYFQAIKCALFIASYNTTFF